MDSYTMFFQISDEMRCSSFIIFYLSSSVSLITLLLLICMVPKKYFHNFIVYFKEEIVSQYTVMTKF